jgi:hypothetical protein
MKASSPPSKAVLLHQYSKYGVKKEEREQRARGKNGAKWGQKT